MLKRFWATFVVAVLVAQPAMAGSLDLVPSLDTMPIARSMFPNQPEAADKAQKAFVMQSGFQSDFDSMRDNMNKKFSKFGDSSKDSTEKFIDNDTPFNAKAVGVTVAAAYLIAFNKSYTQNFGDPLFTGVKHTITIGQDRIMTGITYSF